MKELKCSTRDHKFCLEYTTVAPSMNCKYKFVLYCSLSKGDTAETRAFNIVNLKQNLFFDRLYFYLVSIYCLYLNSKSLFICRVYYLQWSMKIIMSSKVGGCLPK